MYRFLFKFRTQILILLTSIISFSSYSQITVTLGTGTASTSTTAPSPVCDWYKNARHQMRYKASEFNAQGIVGPHNINSIGFNVTSIPSQAHPGYTIKITTIPPSGALSTVFNNALTTVYSNPSQTFVTGWNTFLFNTPFSWNGTDDVLIDVCWSLQGTYTSSGSVQYTTITGDYVYYWNDINLACPMTTGTSNTLRANAQFNLQVPYPPCAGQPIAGNLVSNPVKPCVGKNFTLSRVNGTLASQMVYTWQSAPLNNPTAFSTIPGSPTVTDIYSTVFTGPKYYRIIVSCPASSLSDTSAALFVDSGDFYTCYCDPAMSNSTTTSYFIDSVKISNTTLANGHTGTNTALYQSFPIGTTTTAHLNQNTNYTIYIKRGPSSALDLKVGGWIDYNQNGVFEPSEFFNVTSAYGVPTIVSSTFHVPNGLPSGYTGMRLIMTRSSLSATSPCLTTFLNGEIEDYIVYIEYPPCTQPPIAGTAFSSDSAICANTDFTLIDTGYSQLFTGITLQWEKSTDGINFSPLAGATNDTITTAITVPTYFRMGVKCNNGTPSYSNVIKVELYPTVACYCQSKATTTTDKADIGSVKFGNFLLFSPGGAHLLNQLAVKKYSSNLGYGPLEAVEGSTYPMGIYHIINDTLHKDAKVTVFIDYNRNGTYESTTERVYSGISTSMMYYLASNILMPSKFNSYGLTGFRVILNNNTSGNIPSDEGCGTYLEGETEDYIIILKSQSTTGVENVYDVNNFSVYPSPATDQINVYFEPKTNENYKIEIQNITGQTLYTESSDVHNKYFKQIDISQFATGLYYIKLTNTKTNSTEVRKFSIK